MSNAFMILGFCSDTTPVWGLVGKIVTILRILIPVIVIILGIVSFAQAAVADDSGKEMKGAVSKLLMKFVTAVIIFFIPTIIKALFNFVGIFNQDIKDDYSDCINCITGGTCDSNPSNVQ